MCRLPAGQEASHVEWLLQVFDFHHQKFCPGDFNEKGALYAAVATWPKGIRPVVHWSESQEGRIPHAHSDYISVRPLASILPLELVLVVGLSLFGLKVPFPLMS